MKKRILVLNTSLEVTAMLVELLQDEGYDASFAYIVEIKHGILKLSEILKSTQPDLIIYDVALPYEENWKFFKMLRDLPSTKNCEFILTTTNKSVLDSLVGPTNSIEIVGKPFDLEVLIKAVKSRLKSKLKPPISTR